MLKGLDVAPVNTDDIRQGKQTHGREYKRGFRDMGGVAVHETEGRECFKKVQDASEKAVKLRTKEGSLDLASFFKRILQT